MLCGSKFLHLPWVDRGQCACLSAGYNYVMSLNVSYHLLYSFVYY